MLVLGEHPQQQGLAQRHQRAAANPLADAEGNEHGEAGRGAAEEGQEATVIRHVHHEVWPIVGLLLLTLGLTVWAGFFNDRAADAASQLLAPQRYVAAVLAPERSVLP